LALFPKTHEACGGVTPAEAALFRAIYYERAIPYRRTLCPSDLPFFAARRPYSKGLATEEDCRAALAACLTKGWLQVIDEPALARITDELRLGKFIGPIYGLPTIGSVDFSHAGPDLWLSRGRREPFRFPFTDVVQINSTWYFRTKAASLRTIEAYKEWEWAATSLFSAPLRSDRGALSGGGGFRRATGSTSR
jgi:hypothetical protein